MPTRPPKPCAHPGCDRLTDHARCSEHRQGHTRRYDQRRGTARSRGYDRTWERRRLNHLAVEPFCRQHASQGTHILGSHVDHVIPHRGVRWLFDLKGNLQTLCPPCHTSKTAQEQALPLDLLYPTDLPQPNRPCKVIAGAPGSGKVQHAKDQMQPGDLLVFHGDEWICNQVLRTELLKPDGTLYLIVEAPRIAERAFWAHVLRTDVTLLGTWGKGPAAQRWARVYEADQRAQAAIERRFLSGGTPPGPGGSFACAGAHLIGIGARG